VTSVALSGVRAPYAVVGPCSTAELAGSLVVHVMTAEVAVILVAATPEIVGGVVSGAASVVNVLSPEVATFPAASALLTR
jgi:hypothetical protein